MTESTHVKIVVFVPESNADSIRQVMADAGAGILGSYSKASFSSKGIGRFMPEEGSHPAIGSIGELERVDEERIEMVCSRENAQRVVRAIRTAHPYEEPAIDVYALETL